MLLYYRVTINKYHITRELRKCVPFSSEGGAKPSKRIIIGKKNYKEISSKRESFQGSKLQRSRSSITQKKMISKLQKIILDFSKVDDYWLKK